ACSNAVLRSITAISCSIRLTSDCADTLNSNNTANPATMMFFISTTLLVRHWNGRQTYALSDHRPIGQRCRAATIGDKCLPASSSLRLNWPIPHIQKGLIPDTPAPAPMSYRRIRVHFRALFWPCEQTETTMMQETYNPHDIEPSVQQRWEENQVFKAVIDSNKEKFYCL